MSGLIGGAQPQFILRENNPALQPQYWKMDVHLQALSRDRGFASPWWPGSGFVGDLGLDVSMLDDGQHWFEPIEQTKGRQQRFGVIGVTRDEYGSVLPGVTVMLFRTSDRLFVDQIVSDVNNGTYLLSTPYYPDAHFVVMYKTGSPDKFGTTPNTLIGV